MLQRVAWCAYAALAVFVYWGFLGWRSELPRVLGWSLGYLAMLVAIAVLLALPVAFAVLIRRFGARRVCFALAPTAILATVAYLALSTHYYWTRTHAFDPFLQVAPPILASPSPQPATGELRVLALGGSTTRNQDLPPEFRYPAILQRLLRERHPDATVVVQNAGMNWYTTKHSLIDYVTNLRDWSPTLVVVMHGINDLCRSCTPERFVIPEFPSYKRDWSHFYGPAINGASPPSYLRHSFERLALEVTWKWYAPQRFIERDYPVDHWVALPEYEGYLRRLIHYLRADGVTPVLVTQPSLLAPEISEEAHRKLSFGRAFCSSPLGWTRSELPSPASLGRGLDAFNAVTRRVGAELGVSVVDAASVLPKNLAHFVDDVHFTSVGSEKLARAVADALDPIIGSNASSR